MSKKVLRRILVAFLGTMSFMLTGCYAPIYEMYAPLPFKEINGYVNSKSSYIEGASIKAIHKKDGKDCVHESKSLNDGFYSVCLSCLDGVDVLKEDVEVKLKVDAGFATTETDVTFAKGTSGYYQITRNFHFE